MGQFFVAVPLSVTAQAKVIDKKITERTATASISKSSVETATAMLIMIAVTISRSSNIKFLILIINQLFENSNTAHLRSIRPRKIPHQYRVFRKAQTFWNFCDTSNVIYDLEP